MPPLAEVGRLGARERPGMDISINALPVALGAESFPTSAKGLAWRHRLFRVPACMSTLVAPPRVPQAPRMLDEPPALFCTQKPEGDPNGGKETIMVVGGEARFRGRAEALFGSEVRPPNLCQECEHVPQLSYKSQAPKETKEFCGTWTRRELFLWASPLSTVYRL